MVESFLISLPFDSQDAVPKGFFELEGATVTMEEVRTGKKLCFAIHTKDQRTFLMIASTSDALANWLSVIRVRNWDNEENELEIRKKIHFSSF